MTKKQKSSTSRIVPKYGSSKELARLFRCTENYVSQALNGRVDNSTTRAIRHRALNDFGGVEIGR